jgi:hypothetical protein
VREIIRRLKEKATVLFSSHVMQEVSALCGDRRHRAPIGSIARRSATTDRP